MKLLKLIPAAAIALTAFTTFEAKAEKVCVYNGGSGDLINVYVHNDTKSQTKEIGNNVALAATACAKLGDINVDVGDTFDVYIINGQNNKYYCVKNKERTDSQSGDTKSYDYDSDLYTGTYCKQF